MDLRTDVEPETNIQITYNEYTFQSIRIYLSVDTNIPFSRHKYTTVQPGLIH